MTRPVILITCDVQEDERHPTETLLRLRLNYATAIAGAGGLPLILPPVPDLIDPALDICDGVLLSGSDAGAIVPKLRAAHEARLVAKAMARGLPVLGVCHGMQALGLALGGSVLRDDPALLDAQSPHLPAPVPDRIAHAVNLAPDSLLHRLTGVQSMNVNSLHRHVLLSDGQYSVTATAHDGVTEAIEATSAAFCIGVQWHPEYQLTDYDKHLLRAFVAAATASPQA